MKGGIIGTGIFLLITLAIIIFAYLPAFGYGAGDILQPDCSLTNTCTRYIYTYQHLKHDWTDQWIIDELTVSVRGEPNPPPFSVIGYQGGVRAKIRLYDAQNHLLREDSYASPYEMGLNSEWGFSWTFMRVPNGQYTVGVQYYGLNNEELTGEERRGIDVI